MASSRTLAVICRRQDFQESSRLVHMITREHGRRTFLAKGAHRPKSPFLGGIDLLHVVQARVRVREGRGIQDLFAVQVVQGNLPFRRDPLRCSLALYTVDLARLAMPEGRRDAEVFDLLRGGLMLWARAGRPCLPAILAGIELRMLAALGLLPSLDACPRTGRPFPARGRVGFSRAKGGFVDPREGTRLVPAALPRLAADLVALDGKTLGRTRVPPAAARPLHRLLADLLAWHLGDRPRPALPDGLFARTRAAPSPRS